MELSIKITSTLFNQIVWIWIGIAILIFFVLLKITAPYGRHTKKSWGPMIKNRYGWIIMESPALFVFIYFTVQSANFMNLFVLIPFLLWVTHYIHRTLIFPFRLHTKGKMMPIIIVVFAIMFNFVNGYINGYWFKNIELPINPGLTINARFIAGIIIFITGFIINQYHDKILINLRKTSTNGYKIPYGGLFNKVSCPNFLGEIIEWAGFTILVWSLPALAFFTWTIVNLVPRAIDHHKWYKKQFPDYPQKRKAIIPGVL